MLLRKVCFGFLLLLGLNLHAQVPMIGAQVFIEPGQTEQEIEQWFKVLNEQNMNVCRIRMFESHMLDDDGAWDFSLYDHAFDMAKKYDVKILATLFPSDESLGGFKFPRDAAHKNEIERYVLAVVNHFKGHPALDTWVLQNEAGTGQLQKSDYVLQHYEQWKSKQKAPDYPHEYLKMDYSYEMFWRDYTTQYLTWLAGLVRSLDTENMTHVNNHMLFLTLKEYDFPAWMEVLSTLGASIHAAWHLDYFERHDFNMGIAANCDLNRAAAGEKPFWVTELQGGPNTFSGFDPLTPEKEDIAQWLWSCIGSGAERTIFWTLNARASVDEAGEWAMIDFQHEPTDRLEKAGEIATLLQKEAALFAEARPIDSEITLLYSPLSMFTFSHKTMSSAYENQVPARSEGAHIKSVLAYYQALTGMGVKSNLVNIDQFDWEKAYEKTQTVILPNLISIPTGYEKRMETFVANGNKLVFSGMTGLFDEHMHNVFMTSNPYHKLLGGRIREFQYRNNAFPVTFTDGLELPVHGMNGLIRVDEAEVIAKHGNHVLATQHTLGDGKVFWIPSGIGLGAWLEEGVNPLGKLLRDVVAINLADVPLYFKGDYQGVLLRTLKSQGRYITIFMNAKAEKQEIAIVNNTGARFYRTLYADGEGKISGNRLTLHPGETLVVVW